MIEPTWTMESAGASYAKRIVLNGDVVALVLGMANGQWGVFDTNERRIKGIPTQDSAARCLTAFKNSDAGHAALSRKDQAG